MILGKNENIPIFVQSQKGVSQLDQLIIGDSVFEYGTGKRLEIKEIIQYPISDIWKATYSDGRVSIHQVTEFIFTGYSIVRTIQALESNGSVFSNLKSSQYDLWGDQLRNPLFPDPCIVGVLLMYGDYDDPYMNLPLDRDNVNNLFAHKYNLDYAEKLGNGKTYYKWNGAPSESVITWKEFLGEMDCYLITKRFDSPIIPYQYQHSSILDRRKFIRGVFDLGYDSKIFPDSVGITCKHEQRLKAFQKVLWSTGVNSKVTYDPTNHGTKNYRLDVLGQFDMWPGFDYDINHMEHIIEANNRIVRRDKRFALKIVKMEKIARGYTYNVVLEKPHMVYLSSDYLPLVSV